MGDSGPCGPCSEIFYDHGEHIWGGPPGSPEENGDVEIWNLVFMQYEQEANEIVGELPKPSIDTGMGIERIAAVLQGVHDNYDIDLFKVLIAASEEATSTRAEGDRKAAHRVIADHLRSTCFLIADGVSPSNEGRGYVLRRIMRRAMRYAHLLGKVDVMHGLAPVLVQQMGAAYPSCAAPRRRSSRPCARKRSASVACSAAACRCSKRLSRASPKAGSCPARPPSSSMTPTASRWT